MRETSWRWLGLAPILLYALTVHDYALRGVVGDSLWVCNVSALVLGLGLLARSAACVWTAGIWLVMGTGAWVWDLAMNPRFSWLAMATHFGGIAIALVGTSLHRKPRFLLPLGLAYLAGLQLLCRFVTPASLNVNASHFVYKDLVPYFPSYPLYWLANAALFGALIPLLGWVLERLVRLPTSGRAPAPAPSCSPAAR